MAVADVELAEITGATVRAICRLAVAPDQENLVALASAWTRP